MHFIPVVYFSSSDSDSDPDETDEKDDEPGASGHTVRILVGRSEIVLVPRGSFTYHKKEESGNESVSCDNWTKEVCCCPSPPPQRPE